MKTLPAIPPLLETERLRLRAMCASDVDALFAIYGDAEVMRYASDAPFAAASAVLVMLESVARLLAEGSSIEWAVEEKRTGELIGTCGLHSFEPAYGSAEVGCLLARKAWGASYMREALACVFECAQERLKLIRLKADIDADNVRSIRLFTRLGFTRVQATFYERAL